MARRANGQGTIIKRKDGRWAGVISVSEDGRRKQTWVYGATQAEVVDKLDEVRDEIRKGGKKAVVGTYTVEEFLTRWLKDDVAINRANKTYAGYEFDLKRYVFPHIGHIKLKKLTPELVQQWLAKLAKAGRSANIRKKAISVLRVGLNSAVRLRLLVANPCNAVQKPKVIRREITPLEPQDVVSLLDACKSHRIGGVIALACLTGMRKGELFALKWSAVNLKERILVVRESVEEVAGKRRTKSPKTESGRRVITLDDRAIEFLESRQKAAIKEGLGPKETDLDLVFPDSQGGFLRGSNFDRYVWYKIREAAGVPDTVRFHDLRHTQASLMLAAGIDLKVIQKRLGHSSFEITANTYAHLLQEAQANAVAKLGELLDQAKPQSRDCQK